MNRRQTMAASKCDLPGAICIPGRLANGEDSEWFMSDGTSQVSIGKGSRCPRMVPEDWIAVTHEVARRTAARQAEKSTLFNGVLETFALAVGSDGALVHACWPNTSVAPDPNMALCGHTHLDWTVEDVDCPVCLERLEVLARGSKLSGGIR